MIYVHLFSSLLLVNNTQWRSSNINMREHFFLLFNYYFIYYYYYITQTDTSFNHFLNHEYLHHLFEEHKLYCIVLYLFVMFCVNKKKLYMYYKSVGIYNLCILSSYKTYFLDIKNRSDIYLSNVCSCVVSCRVVCVCVCVYANVMYYDY